VINIASAFVLFCASILNKHYKSVEYIKDDKNVYYQTEIIKGADAKTFRLVIGKKWDAEDKLNKYKVGIRQD
jgi:hypothetical protein